MRRHGAIHVPAPAAVPHLGQVARLARLAMPSHGSWFEARPPIGVAIPADNDPLNNDSLGCCVPAADWRWIQAVIAARGRLIRIDPGWVTARYEMTGDYVPGNPATDQGTDTARDMLNWVASPIVIPTDGTLIKAGWAKVPPTSDDEIARALGQAPALVTFNLPASRADDIEAWGYPPDGEAGTEGHRMCIGAWDGRERVARTWGEDSVSPSIHPDFWNAYCVAFDVPVLITGDPDYDFAGMDYDALAVAMANVRAISGES